MKAHNSFSFRTLGYSISTCITITLCVVEYDALNLHWVSLSILLTSRKVLSHVLNIAVNRRSYMSAHVLLNLLNELGKRDKMWGLPSILSLFRNEFNKFNNTRARMLDSIYHMIKSHFCRTNVIILSLCTQRCYGRHNVSRKSINH